LSLGCAQAYATPPIFKFLSYNFIRFCYIKL